MATPYISDKQYLAKARTLKKFGLIEINLREKLTPAKKGLITRLTHRDKLKQGKWKNFSDEEKQSYNEKSPPLKSLIENPELFKTRKVNKKQAAKWRASGYKVINGHVIVKGEKGAVTKVFGNRIQISRANIVEDIYLFGSHNFFQMAKKLLGRQMKKHEYILGRFGNYGNFKTMFVSYDSFYDYIAEKTNNFTNELTQQLQLVHQYRAK